jgi:hypothetical protein
MLFVSDVVTGVEAWNDDAQEHVSWEEQALALHSDKHRYNGEEKTTA